MIASKRSGTVALLAAAAVLLGGCASMGGGGNGGGGGVKEAIGGGGQRLAMYSPGIRSGDFIFFSGQIGSRPGGGGLPPTVEEQTQQALANLERLMEQAGVTKADLVKCTVFLADIRDYGAMNGVYAQFFEGTVPPARSAVGVAGLPAGARVEVECMAAAG